MSAHRSSRPEPLLTRAGITSAVSGLISLLVSLGIIAPTLGGQLSGAAEAVITAVFTCIAVAAPLAHAFASRSAVTPVSDPQDSEGNKLAPVTDFPLDSADEALARAADTFPADGEAA